MFLCINKVSIFIVLHKMNMFIRVTKADWVHVWMGAKTFAWGGPVFEYVSLFFFKSFGHDPCLWLFWRSFYLGAFACIYNGLLKGWFSSVPSCCINSYLTPLLVSPHDLLQPNTSTFSTSALIWVHFKIVHFFKSNFQFIFIFKNALHNLVMKICSALKIIIFFTVIY